MTEIKMTQAVPKSDTTDDLHGENELLFQDTLKEYATIFGGICHRDAGLSKSICMSFDLAKEHVGLTNTQVNAFYLQNYILNKKEILQKVKRSHRKNQLMRSIQTINFYLDINRIYNLVEISSEDLSLKRFLQECYIDFQILHPKRSTLFAPILSSMDRIHLESLKKYTNDYSLNDYSLKVLEKK